MRSYFTRPFQHLLVHLFTRPLAVAAFVAGFAGAVQAQTPSAAPSFEESAAQRAEEHARIRLERDILNQRSVAKEADCYQQFAVSACLSQVRAKRRISLIELKRQEVALHDAERLQRSERALQARQERRAAHAQVQSEQALQPPSSPAQPKLRAAKNTANAAQATAERAANHATKQARQARKVGAEAAQQQQYEDKQQAAIARRQSRADQQAQSTKPLAQPLPAPTR